MRFDTTYEEQKSMSDWFRMVPRLGCCEKPRALRFEKNKCVLFRQNESCSRCPDRDAAPCFAKFVAFLFFCGGVHSDPNPLSWGLWSALSQPIQIPKYKIQIHLLYLWLDVSGNLNMLMDILVLHEQMICVAPPRASIPGQSSSRNPRLLVFVVWPFVIAYWFCTLDF